MLRPVRRPTRCADLRAGRPRPSRHHAPIAGLALMLATGPGCVRHVLLISDPPGATIERRGEVLGPTPIELDVWNIPFFRQEVSLSMAGYRSVAIQIDRKLGWFRGRTTQQLVLIPEHGPAGSWTPEDARKAR